MNSLFTSRTFVSSVSDVKLERSFIIQWQDVHCWQFSNGIARINGHKAFYASQMSLVLAANDERPKRASAKKPGRRHGILVRSRAATLENDESFTVKVFCMASLPKVKFILAGCALALLRSRSNANKLLCNFEIALPSRHTPCDFK